MFVNMNERITSLYIVIQKNKTVSFDTNLKYFVSNFLLIEPTARNYDWFYRQFKKSRQFTCVINNKEYHFERLV